MQVPANIPAGEINDPCYKFPSQVDRLTIPGKDLSDNWLFPLVVHDQRR